ncbi:MAG: hypothetical protein IJ759_07970 [Bacteroidales bacterium]|nr:hypothetical protein [Bacteroidales bacterium]
MTYLDEDKQILQIDDRYYIKVLIHPNNYFGKCFQCAFDNEDCLKLHISGCGCGFFRELDTKEIKTIKKICLTEN